MSYDDTLLPLHSWYMIFIGCGLLFLSVLGAAEITTRYKNKGNFRQVEGMFE
jgi:hypothetical protein